MKFFFKALLGGLVLMTTLVIMAIAGGAYWGYTQFTKSGPLQEKILITIHRGASVYSISENLMYQGAIEFNSYSPINIFVHASKLTGQSTKIKAGEYEITPHMSMQEILDKLEAGKTFVRKITIREGLTNHEILLLLLSQDDLEKGHDFLIAMEGHYLPETYSYQTNDSVPIIMNRMKVAMEKVLDEAWEKRADNLPIKTKEEALVLASIIEKETAVASERKKVAGVFINRLRKGIALQTDPTVIYALTMGEHKNDGQGPLGRRLLKKDLEYDSPYNTYKYKGLPPGPICNPGKASIEAALNPAEHKYFYFVANGSGGHAFAKTLSDHNSNVAKWRKIRKSK